MDSAISLIGLNISKFTYGKRSLIHESQIIFFSRIFTFCYHYWIANSSFGSCLFSDEVIPCNYKIKKTKITEGLVEPMPISKVEIRRGRSHKTMRFSYLSCLWQLPQFHQRYTIIVRHPLDILQSGLFLYRQLTPKISKYYQPNSG